MPPPLEGAVAAFHPPAPGILGGLVREAPPLMEPLARLVPHLNVALEPLGLRMSGSAAAMTLTRAISPPTGICPRFLDPLRQPAAAGPSPRRTRAAEARARNSTWSLVAAIVIMIILTRMLILMIVTVLITVILAVIMEKSNGNISSDRNRSGTDYHTS